MLSVSLMYLINDNKENSHMHMHDFRILQSKKQNITMFYEVLLACITTKKLKLLSSKISFILNFYF